MDVTAWLLDSDPALQWQVQRDLLAEPDEVWRATRDRVATEGFGARLLSHQDRDGQWAGGAFFPAGFTGGGEGQPYTATTWSLNSLREWGVPAQILAGTAEKLARNSRWEYDDLPYWGGEVDACINSWTLANGSWLGAEIAGLRAWFGEHQLTDGGWNCEWVEGSTRSSFHSTLNVLHGLLADQELTGSDETAAIRHRGEEYLLARRLMVGERSGEVVGPWVTELTHPWRARYSVLNALSHFRSAALHDGTDPDPRLAEAVEVVRAARRPDGTWHQDLRLPGEVWFETDEPAGDPSRWLTFHALTVLQWWDGRPA